MGKECLAKEKVVFDENNGALKVVLVFDIIAAIATFIYIIRFMFLLPDLGSSPRPIRIIIWILFFAGLISSIYCLIIRNILLRHGHKTLAVLLNLLFAIGWPIEFVAGIIVACSNLYLTEVEVDNNINSDDLYKEVDEIYNHHLRNDNFKIELSPRAIELKELIIKRKKQLTADLNAIKNMEQRCGLTSEQMLRKQQIISEIEKCDNAITICKGKKTNAILNEICDAETRVDNSDIDALVEKSKELSLEKQDIFNKHKKYYDSGIYSSDEFINKVTPLFVD